MHFKRHSPALASKHAFLAPSKYHWLNYTEEKMDRAFAAAMASQRGTELHQLAHDLIRLGVKLEDTGATLNSYVNDAIGFRMTSEQMLFYSDNCFGTADTIAFRKAFLRIHDLKTGLRPCSMNQLKIYAGIFCLEYDFKPVEIETQLRIYQNDDVIIEDADPMEITYVMDRIITVDKWVQRRREEALP